MFGIITDPVIIYTYDSTSKGKNGDRRSGVNYAVAHAVEVALYQQLDLNDIIYNIINAVQNVSKSRYFGISVLINVLLGIDDKKIFDNKLDKVPEFGIYKDVNREILQSIIEWMIKEHYLLKTKEKYPVLHSTFEGLHYCDYISEKKVKELKKYIEEEVIVWGYS